MTGDNGDDDGEDQIEVVPFWWTAKGQIIRWAIFGTIVALALLYLVFAYIHAQRRMKKGLPPLAYHRWLVTRRQRAQYDSAYHIPMPTYNRPNEYYGHYAAPPPVYDNNYQAPPTYQPPESGAKDVQSQWTSTPVRRPESAGEAAPEYTPPPGPPPAALRTESYR